MSNLAVGQFEFVASMFRISSLSRSGGEGDRSRSEWWRGGAQRLRHQCSSPPPLRGPPPRAKAQGGIAKDKFSAYP